jgi:methylase of polypeptide subunit release factors
MAADLPDAGDGTALLALRAALERADFTAERVEERLGTHELSSRPLDTAVHLRRLDEDDAFSTLTRLFLLGDAVEAGRVEAVTSPVGIEGLARLRLVTVEGESVRALVRLVPHGDYYVASDAGQESGADVPFDHVPGIQAPSVTLAKLAVRRHCGSALDLGTGCGIQALLAAKHADRVVATDPNPRALGYAAFNAALNGIETIELRPGAGFEPLESERFDLIVANPPYVISPDASYAYRDSGLPGDELCRSVVEEAARHLAEGGFAHVLVSWAHPAGGDWAEPLRVWVEQSGCDAWLLHYRTSDPVAHAAGWLRPLGEADHRLYAEALDRWLEHLRRLGIDAIGYGAVVLRRRGGGRNWIRTDPLPLERLEPAGEHTLRVFAAQDLLEGLDEEGLLELRLALVGSHRLQQTLAARDGVLFAESQTLELTEGLRFAVGVDRHTVSLLPHFDGRRPLRDVLALAGGTFELEPEERERFVPAALPVVRRLLELGFLEPG